MKRLSALDALFLYLESPETPMHVASLTIFKPLSPSDDLFARFREHTAARLDLLPSYRRRLEPTPLGIDHPAWVIEDKLDLDYHIRHEALPKPGGMAELRALVAQIHGAPLDRARPLWEYHFIEGLEDGAFAVYVKVHHSAMDGMAGMATLGVVYDLAPEAGRETLPQRIVPPDVEPSDFIELTSTALGDFIRQGWRAVTSLPGVARALSKAAPHLARDARFLYRYVRDMPRTPFNAAISAHRVYATSSLPLSHVKALAKSRGVTINDVVLALCAGGLRRYLALHSALPPKPLTAGVPASLRPFGDAKLNNQVVFTLSRLPTDVAEPLPRLAAAHAAADEAKNLFADVRDLLTTDVSILGAPLVVTALARLWAGARAANYLWPSFNVIVSNVPGPREPFYCVGAPATHYFPASIPFHGCALNITVQSYLDQLDFGLIACSETVPDAQRIADFIAEDFQAMQKADAEARTIDMIAVAPKPAAIEAREPIHLADFEAEPRKGDAEKESPLTLNIEALSAATEDLLRKLNPQSEPPAAPKPAAAKPVASAAKASSAKSRRAEPASARKTPAGASEGRARKTVDRTHAAARRRPAPRAPKS